MLCCAMLQDLEWVEWNLLDLEWVEWNLLDLEWEFPDVRTETHKARAVRTSTAGKCYVKSN